MVTEKYDENDNRNCNIQKWYHQRLEHKIMNRGETSVKDDNVKKYIQMFKKYDFMLKNW